MPILAEILGDDGRSDHQEGGHAERQEHHHAEQVLGVPQEVLHAWEYAISQPDCETNPEVLWNQCPEMEE